MILKNEIGIDQIKQLTAKSVNLLFANCNKNAMLTRETGAKLKPISRDITFWGKH